MRGHAVHDDADGHGTPSGCGYYRIVMAFDEMNKHGHKMTYAAGEPKLPEGVKLAVAQRFDNPAALRYWRRFRARARTVYEIDDDVWNVPPANWLAYKTYRQDFHLDAVETAIGIADMVTVTTERLAEIVFKFNPEVRIVPNVIPGELLTWERPPPPDTRRRTVTIGWRGGASHALDMQIVAEPLRHVLRENKHARLHLVGTDFRPTIEAPAEFTNWVPIDASLRYFKTLTPFDIGIAPLSGLEFDRSKSNIAALEYAALGIPCVATDAEPYRDFIEDGKTGYLIRRKRDWAKRIAELVNDDAAREEMGRAARAKAAGWTIEEHWSRWAEVYHELV